MKDDAFESATTFLKLRRLFCKISFFITLLQWLQNIAHLCPHFTALCPHLNLSMSSFYSHILIYTSLCPLFIALCPHLNLSLFSFFQPYHHLHLSILFLQLCPHLNLSMSFFYSSVSSFTLLSVLFVQLCVLIYTSLCPLLQLCVLQPEFPGGHLLGGHHQTSREAEVGGHPNLDNQDVRYMI